MARNRKTSSPRSPKPAAPAKFTPTALAAMQDDFRPNASYELVQNAVTSVSVADLAKRREIVTGADHSFSIRLDDWPVTNQKSSGRCWMFAGLVATKTFRHTLTPLTPTRAKLSTHSISDQGLVVIV